MKVKELQKTVNVAWSPAEQYPILLAAGTAAQQLDTSLNESSTLEIYSANLLDASYDLELKGSLTSQYRFQKIVWSPTGFNATHPNGLIVGGCESGHLQIYSAAKLLASENALVAHQDKHTGPIRGLDFNTFQHNLLASVASESEIFIWDLNNTTTPMAPGTKSQPLEDIQNVAWNRQVQHILSSVFSSKCVIWDLRKNEQIIKLSDSQSRVRWRAVQWHPEIATQLWLASEDDQAPFVQLWDLRYATAPTKSIQIHQRGILGLTWCPNDSDLMVSCGKDNKIYCWNPNSELPGGEILSEIATTMQWYSDVQWCPRNPALIASSSLDGNVSIYSLFGGSHQQVQTSNKIADSFPGMEQFAQGPVPQAATQTVYSDLLKPPKWMKRPTGCSFGFGGRLISFNSKNPSQVTINQVITEPEFVQRSNLFEKTLEQGNFVDFCREKADQMPDQYGRYVWYFLKANFEADPKGEMLNLLGYNKDDIGNKFQKYIREHEEINESSSIDRVTNQIANLSHVGDDNALFDAIAAGNKLMTEKNDTKETTSFKIPTGENNEGLICQAILSGNIEAAVDLCMESDKPAEALIIAVTGGPEFLAKTQQKYLKKTNGYLSNIISALVTHDWSGVITQCTIDSWKEVLVAILTHNQKDSKELCTKIGERLQAEMNNDLNMAKNAVLCYICAGNVEKLVDVWTTLNKFEKNDNQQLSTNELQDLIEIVMLMQKSLELQGQNIQPTGKLADFLSQYAGILASQGALQSALSYLWPSDNPELVELRERLYYALGHKQQQKQQQQLQQNQRKQRTFSRGDQNQQTNFYGIQNTTPANPFAQRTSISGPSMAPPPLLPPVNNFNTNLPGQMQSNAISTPWNSSILTQPAQQTPLFNQMQPQTASMPQQPVQSKPPLAPPPSVNDGLSQPARPSSVGSQGSVTSLPRSKYVIDPSVSSGPNYGQITNNLYNPQQSSNFNAQPFNPAPMNFNTVPANNSGLPYPSIGQDIQSSPLIPANPIQNNFQPLFPPSNPLGNMNLSGLPPIEMGQQAVPPPPLQFINKNPTPPPGWNDPPTLTTSRHQPKVETNQSNPITHPLFGVDPNQGQNGYPDPNGGFQNNQYQNVPLQPQMMSPPPPPSSQQVFQNQPPQSAEQFQQQNPRSYPNQMNFQPQAVSQFYQSQHETPAPSKVEPPKEKLPLPEEFIYLQTVFEELKTQCLNAAPDPRTKRKFVDIAKRLECLYDSLREHKLTPNTISALNQIVQYIQNGDYQNAMGTYTMIVSGPDFSQTVSFMPGIKVLLQSASELKVYLT